MRFKCINNLGRVWKNTKKTGLLGIEYNDCQYLENAPLEGLTLNRSYSGQIISSTGVAMGHSTGTYFSVVIFNDQNQWVEHDLERFIPCS